MLTTRIDIAGLHVAVTCQRTSRRVAPQAPVLYVHGATFPATLAAFWRFDSVSWADTLNEAGFDVFGLDFLGYGASDRYAEMGGPPEGGPAPGRAAQAAEQIAAAVDHVRAQTGSERVHIVAHSWGTMAAGLYATLRPETLDRLVLFGPITPDRAPPREQWAPRWQLVSAQDQWSRFSGYCPAGEEPVITRELFEPWGEAYLDSDAHARERTPAAVKVPGGPVADLFAAQGGVLPYEPERITSPTLVIRGEWDEWPTEAGAQWLFGALLNSPGRRKVTIARGTHVMHLESSRFALYEATRSFLFAR